MYSVGWINLPLILARLPVLLDGLRRYYLSYESAVLGTAQWTPRANISLRYLQTIMAMGDET